MLEKGLKLETTCESPVSSSDQSLNGSLNLSTGDALAAAKPKEKRWECQYCGKLFAFRHPLVALVSISF